MKVSEEVRLPCKLWKYVSAQLSPKAALRCCYFGVILIHLSQSDHSKIA